MLNNDDRAAIEGLFARLKDVERKAAPRDPEAEALIGEVTRELEADSARRIREMENLR